ncbi:MAG: hypothetical protein MHM6MM_003639 [Cercozoa sp. M6MM]
MTDLKRLLRQRMLEDVIAPCRKRRNEMLVMVVDERTVKTVSSCLRMHELNAVGVGVAVDIQFERERMDCGAVYLLTPSRASVRRLCADFDKKDKPKYRRAHVFFSCHLPDELFEMIRSHAYLPRFIASLKDAYCDFIAAEPRVFVCGHPMPWTPAALYLPHVSQAAREADDSRMSVEALLDDSASRIAALCVALQEAAPHIRHCSSSSLNEALAQRVHARLSHAQKSLNLPVKEKRATLLILDRTAMPLAALMHDFAYEAAIADFFGFDGERVQNFLVNKNCELVPRADDPARRQQQAKNKELREIMLKEEDEVWAATRDLHFFPAAREINARLQTFIETNAAVALQRKEKRETRDLRDAIQALPQYYEQMRVFGLHSTLSARIRDLVRDQEGPLASAARMEQDLATGFDEYSQFIPLSKAQEQLSSQLMREDMHSALKLRLLLVYVCAAGGIDTTILETLFSNIALSAQQRQAVVNLRYLGCNIGDAAALRSSNGGEKKSGFLSKLRRLHTRRDLADRNPLYFSDMRVEAVQQHIEQSELTFMRFVPKVREYVESLINEGDAPNPSQHVPSELDRTAFPFLTPTPPADYMRGRAQRRQESKGRSVRHVAQRGRNRQQDRASNDVADVFGGRPKLIVFVQGGLTFSEKRELLALAKQRQVDLVLGSNDFITPPQFVDALGHGKQDTEQLLQKTPATTVRVVF